MNKVRKIVSSILIVFVLLIAINSVYKLTLWKNDVRLFAPMLSELWDIEHKTDVLYLGDCSDLSTDVSDSTSLGISGILNSYFPEWKVNNISHWGSHSGMYLSLLKRVDPAASIKTVVVTLNLRTFSPASLYSIYENNFIQSQILMRNRPPLFNRFVLAAGWYDTLNIDQRHEALRHRLRNQSLTLPYEFKFSNTAEWDSAMSHGTWKTQEGEWDMQRIEAACYAVKDYAMTLDSLHPRIADLDEIVRLAEIRNWNLIFNLLPENVSNVEELVSSDLTYFIKENRDFLLDRYRDKRVHVIDNMELLESSEFIEFTPNEHYTSSGRTKLAESVARALFTYYAEEGFSSSETFKKVSLFEVENNLEYHHWENLQTLTTKYVHSGQYASKTDAKEPYSIALVKILPEMPGNFSNWWFEFSCYVYTEHPVEDILLVYDLEAKGVERHWRGIKLREHFDIQMNTWQKIRHQYKVPTEYVPSERIKVYIFNNSGTPFYVDDIHIELKGS